MSYLHVGIDLYFLCEADVIVCSSGRRKKEGREPHARAEYVRKLHGLKLVFCMCVGGWVGERCGVGEWVSGVVWCGWVVWCGVVWCG